jgi:hypothetical protein
MSVKYAYILGKLTKGSIAQAHLLGELQWELAATTAAQNIQKEQARASKHCIQKGGIISSMELNRMARMEKQVDDLLALNHLWKKWRKVVNEFMEIALARGFILKKLRFGTENQLRMNLAESNRKKC